MKYTHKFLNKFLKKGKTNRLCILNIVHRVSSALTHVFAHHHHTANYKHVFKNVRARKTGMYIYRRAYARTNIVELSYNLFCIDNLLIIFTVKKRRTSLGSRLSDLHVALLCVHTYTHMSRDITKMNCRVNGNRTKTGKMISWLYSTNIIIICVYTWNSRYASNEEMYGEPIRHILRYTQIIGMHINFFLYPLCSFYKKSIFSSWTTKTEEGIWFIRRRIIYSLSQQRVKMMQQVILLIEFDFTLIQ